MIHQLNFGNVFNTTKRMLLIKEYQFDYQNCREI